MPSGCVKINCPIENKISKGSTKNELITKYNNKTIPNIIKNRSAFIIQKMIITIQETLRNLENSYMHKWYLFLINTSLKVKYGNINKNKKKFIIRFKLVVSSFLLWKLFQL